MKTLLLLVTVCSAIFQTLAHATTIGFSPVPTARIVRNSANGALNDTNSLVFAGTFSSTTFSLNNTLSLSANVAAVMAAGGWKAFGFDTVTNAVSSLPPTIEAPALGVTASGKLGGQVTDNNFISTQADFFNNKPLYVWIFNAPTIGAATEMGIFRGTSGTNAPWVFPTNAGGVGDTITFSTTNAIGISAIGGFGTSASGLLQLTNNFNVSAVPEPTTLIFGLITGVAAIYSRLRRK